MKTLNGKLLLPIIFLLLAQGQVQAKVNAEETAPKIEARQMDQRAEILQGYLSKYNSPMQYQAQDFIDAADAYNLDWKLLPAIAGVESTFGKFIPGGYNAWGWGVYGNQAIYFDSWREGMFTVSAGLRKNYLDRGLTDPASINRMYSTSPRWNTNVTFFLMDMERFQEQYERNQAKAASTDLIAQAAGSSARLTTIKPERFQLAPIQPDLALKY